jgi:hypothetical protein
MNMRKKEVVFIALMAGLAVLVLSVTSFPNLWAAGTVTKGLIGKEDMNVWKGGSDPRTFQRPTSSGYTQTLTKVVLGGSGGGESACNKGSTLEEVIAAVGSDNTTLLVDCDLPVSITSTFPSNLNIQILKGGRILCQTSSVNLVFNGFVGGDPAQVFYGCGNVTIANSLEIYPEWWGSVNDGNHSDTFAVQSAINAAPDNGGKVKLSSKDWAFNATVNKPSITIEGSWTGQHGLIYSAEDNPKWRAADKTLPILRVYSDRYDTAGTLPYMTSAIIRNFIMEGGGLDSHAWGLAARAQKGLHIDQGTKGIYVDNFCIQGFTDYQVYIGKPVTHSIMDINFNNFSIIPVSGGGQSGGIGDGIRATYGDAPLAAYNWATGININNGLIWQASSYHYAWDNATAYTAGVGIDIMNHVVVELNDNQAETDVAKGSGKRTHQFKFRIENDADLVVKLHRERDGNETTLRLSTDYAVTGDHNGTILLASSIPMWDNMDGGADNSTDVDGNLTSGYSLRMLRASDYGVWGYIYVCTTAGTSATGLKATAEPHWNHTVGGTTTDGSVVWTTHQRGRALNLYGVGVNMNNAGIEGAHYGGIRLQKTTQPYSANVHLSNASISGETTGTSVQIENDMDDYPWSYSVHGISPFWSGGYKPKNRPKYDPANAFAGQTYTMSSIDGLVTWRPTILDGLRIQSFSKDFSPLYSPYIDIYRATYSHGLFPNTLMIAAGDDNITLYTPYKIHLEMASEVVMPDVNYAIDKTLNVDSNTTTFDGSSIPQIQLITLYAAHPVTLTDINLETDNNSIKTFSSDLIAVGERYTHFTQSAHPNHNVSDGNITDANETVAVGKVLSNYFPVRSGKNYKLTINLTLNSGAAPYIYTYSGDASHSEPSIYAKQLSNGVNTFFYTAAYSGSASYILVQNTAAGDWSALFTLHEHKMGIQKILFAGDDNTTIGHSASKISLSTGVAVPMASGDMVGLLSVGGIWKEMWRNIATP